METLRHPDFQAYTLSPLFVAFPSVFVLSPLSTAFTHSDRGVGGDLRLSFAIPPPPLGGVRSRHPRWPLLTTRLPAAVGYSFQISAGRLSTFNVRFSTSLLSSPYELPFPQLPCFQNFLRWPLFFQSSHPIFLPFLLLSTLGYRRSVRHSRGKLRPERRNRLGVAHHHHANALAKPPQVAILVGSRQPRRAEVAGRPGCYNLTLGGHYAICERGAVLFCTDAG